MKDIKASLAAQMVKNLPPVQDTQVWSLGWEDLLKKRMATHSSILAWRISWTEESQRVRHKWATNIHIKDIKEHESTARQRETQAEILNKRASVFMEHEAQEDGTWNYSVSPI